MFQDLVPIISIPIVLFYMAKKEKRSSYAVGGLLLLIGFFIAFTKPSFFEIVSIKYIPCLQAKTIVWSLFIFTVVVGGSFFIYSYRKEAKEKGTPVL